MNKRRYSRGIKKYIRREKARIRRMNIEEAERQKLICELLNSLNRELKTNSKAT